ncbi:hypothetical protein DJ79_10515 [Halorubrum ezzemoulense]|uniref:DUF2281 domain-containing protein n=1 Tax=Halorubrum ezzemoulense TaxID=337243 RepID=A0A256JDI3_HALEZ|nr:hypothetical protein DJ79_10515 [Halorubrum ezzemoulense]OYR71252.1 hypothetical protein DJ76_15155 [Halorubrum ezzemoulense]
MSYEPPTQPANLPTKIVNALNESPPEQLRDVVKYAEVLAEHKEREARLGEEADQDDCDIEHHLDSIHPPGMSAIPREIVTNHVVWPMFR